jgi:hypothetical protein
VRTSSGLAWFTLDTNTARTATLRVTLAARKLNIHYTSGLKTKFGTDEVILTGHGLVLTVWKTGATEHVSFTSSALKTSGKVVSGTFKIV